MRFGTPLPAFCRRVTFLVPVSSHWGNRFHTPIKLPEVDVEGGLLQLKFQTFFFSKQQISLLSCHGKKEAFLKRVRPASRPAVGVFIVSGEYQVGGADDHRQSL